MLIAQFAGKRQRHVDIARGEIRYHSIRADQTKQARHPIHIPWTNSTCTGQEKR